MAGSGGSLWGGLLGSVPFGGLVQAGGSILDQAINGGPSSWGSEQLHDYVTDYVPQAALDRIPASARANAPAFLEAYAQALVDLGWGPKDTDPNRQAIITRMEQIRAMAGEAPGNPDGGAASGQPKSGQFRWFWPWTKGAMREAQWYHWVLWLCGLGVIIFLGWKLISPNKYKRKWRAYKRQYNNQKR